MTQPRIIVIMPVYNGAAYLRESMQSILSQTFGDFEFLIIDDGSTDESIDIVTSYSDRRIRLTKNDHKGSSSSRNIGFNLAGSEYAAVMDCDDIGLPQRFERQTAMLDRNPDIAACGGWVVMFDDSSEAEWCAPAAPQEINCRLLFETVIPHSTAMFRRRR